MAEVFFVPFVFWVPKLERKGRYRSQKGTNMYHPNTPSLQDTKLLINPYLEIVISTFILMKFSFIWQWFLMCYINDF